MSEAKAYEKKERELVSSFKSIVKQSTGKVALQKNTSSNLYRVRNKIGSTKLDVSQFNTVIKIDTRRRVAEVEGMTTYEDLVDAALKKGFMPTVVPDFKQITVGGGFVGAVLESSSFKYGFAHDTILKADVLVGDGRVVTCTRNNRYKDLFYALPNSYGTLGYVLKLDVMLVPVKKYVKVTHRKYSDIPTYLKDIAKIVKRERSRKGKLGFVEGIAFNKNDIVLTTGEFVDSAPFVSDYTKMRIYYKSIREKKVDYLTTYDYIWRWEPDWFWGSKHFFASNPVVRFFWPKSKLNTLTYMKIRDWDQKHRFMERLNSLRNKRTESIVQDAQIPFENASKFIAFMLNEIQVFPFVIGPVKPYDKRSTFDFFLLNPSKLYMNIGCYDYRYTEKPDGYYNRLFEKKARALGGQKMLYSRSLYSEKEFWSIYNKRLYDRLKRKYDPHSIFKDLYEKCVKAK